MSQQQGAEILSRGFDHPKERNHMNGMQFNTAKFRGIFSRTNNKILLQKELSVWCDEMGKNM